MTSFSGFACRYGKHQRHAQADRCRSNAPPWVKPVMEDFINNSVRDIAVQCAAQSSKTQTVMNCAC